MTRGPGPARVEKVPPLRSAVVRALSRAGIEAVVHSCTRMDEGEAVEERGARCYYGSSMVTLDTARLAARAGGRVDPDELLRHLRASPLFNLRLMRMARVDAARRCAASAVATARYTFSARREGERIEITIDVEIRGCEELGRAQGR